MTYAAYIIDQLVLQGVSQFCIAPGSRSAPLAICAQAHPKAKTFIHFDERGVGFYALGMSKATKKPTAIITTSGTAVANLTPSCMEAYHSKTPLILLTADRPHELRKCGANQTTEQLQLFQAITKWQFDLAPHIDEKTARSITAQAVFQSLEGTIGPVQLNCPLQEPLYDPLSFLSGKAIIHTFAKKVAPPFQLDAKKGIILIGSNVKNPKAILSLAKKLKWPVFADILSNARQFQTHEQIRHFHFILQHKIDLKPDHILYFGDAFISKHILSLDKHCPMTLISPFDTLQDPERRISHRVESDIEPFCETLECSPSDLSWLEEWKILDEKIDTLIHTHFQENPFTEAKGLHFLDTDLPLYLGNSMPIRYADQFFFPKKCPLIFANRGVSGIDGNIATIAGLSDGLNSPMIGLIGDQTALHDLNSFSLLKNRPILLIICNNFGGNIFDYLPSKNSPFLDSLFAASHAWNFESIGKMFDLPYLRVNELSNNLPFHGILELVTNRQNNAEFQKNLSKKIMNSDFF